MNADDIIQQKQWHELTPEEKYDKGFIGRK